MNTNPVSRDIDAIIDILRNDYARFPTDQTYEIYASDVYFKDPTSEFRGVARYRQTIAFIDRWFKQAQLDLHDIDYKPGHSPNTFDVRTEWTLSWTTPLPWSPHVTISGWSDLVVSGGVIVSHIDGWRCSGWDVVRQHFSS
jgi:hypothetical protein